MLKYVAVCNAGNGQTGEQMRFSRSGVAAYQDHQLITCIDDITLNHSDAERLADLLNKFEASLLHFHDIVEDFIAML